MYRGQNNIGRVDVSEPASISAGIADRYATAIFEIASESNSLDSRESSMNDLAAALADSEDLQALLTSPVISREEQGAGVRQPRLAERDDRDPHGE